MSVIFICPGDCGACAEAERCPEKPKREAEAFESLLETFGSPRVAEIMLKIVDRFSPEQIVKLLNSALFRLIQFLIIESEDETGVQLTRENVQERIKSIFPPKHKLLLDLFHQGNQRAKNDPFVQKIINKLIPELAEKIIAAVGGTCDKRCGQCWLNEQCPKSYEASASH